MSSLVEWIRNDPLRLAPYYFCVWLILTGHETPFPGDVIGFRSGGKRRELKVLEVLTPRSDGGRMFIRAEGHHPIDIVTVGR